jgi:hypothetical protein
MVLPCVVTMAAERRANAEPLPPLPPSSAPSPETDDAALPPLPPPSVEPQAASTTDSAEARAEATRRDEQAHRARHTSFRAEPGFQYAQLHGVSITGARLRLGVGGENAFGGHYASGSVLFGGTEGDLRTWDVRFGWTGDLTRFRIVRVGLDADLVYLSIRRASIDDRLWALGLGMAGHASFDLYAFDPRGDHALTANLRFDATLFSGGLLWGPSVALGFRY